MYKVQLVG